MCYSILVEKDFEWLAREFGASLDQAAFDSYAALRGKDPKKFKDIAAHPRIYPNYWAPVVVAEHGKPVIRPMRYRVLPSWSPGEIPTRYNLFNARLDMLEERRTWRGVFGRRHGLVVFTSFFEWVEADDGKKRVLRFFPEDHRRIVAPVLWDVWDKQQFDAPEAQKLPFDRLESFAVITGDPRPEVLAAGHDRTPIFLRREAHLPWLSPSGKTRDDLFRLLLELDDVRYGHELAAA